MASTPEGGKKATEASKEHDPQAFEKMNRAGTEGLNKDPQRKSQGSQKAGETRGSEAGRKGTEHSQGGAGGRSGEKETEIEGEQE